MKIYFSAKKMGFYFDSLMADYERNGVLPNDLDEVTLKIYEVYQSQPPEGMQLGADDGRPVWVPIVADKTEEKD